MDRARLRRVTFLLSLLLLSGSGRRPQFRFEENVIWIGAIGARYHLGVDGISLWLVLLTTLADADRDSFELDRDH